MIGTSVISALFDERTPERQTLTEEFWEKISSYHVYLSEITEKEMEAASETLKGKMIQATKHHCSGNLSERQKRDITEDTLNS